MRLFTSTVSYRHFSVGWGWQGGKHKVTSTVQVEGALLNSKYHSSWGVRREVL